MWNRFSDIVSLLFNLGRDTQQNRADIKRLENQVNELTQTMQTEIRGLREGMQRLAYEVQRVRDEMQHVKDNEAHEREKLALRLEVEMLRAAKQLPAPKAEEPSV